MKDYERRCIWCLRDSSIASFKNRAHVVPKSLGGTMICSSVCDECNSYYGNRDGLNPSIEQTIREAFIISRTKFLDVNDGIGRNKPMARAKSHYFNIDLKSRTIRPKAQYKLQNDFMRRNGIQLCRGIYKMFLETLSAEGGDACHESFNRIRSFSRYGEDAGLAVYYFLRRHGVFLQTKKWSEQPAILMGDSRPFSFLIQNDAFVEFEFLGHVFGICLSENKAENIIEYCKQTIQEKALIFKGMVRVLDFDDVDLGLTVLSDGPDYDHWIAARNSPLLWD